MAFKLKPPFSKFPTPIVNVEFEEDDVIGRADKRGNILINKNNSYFTGANKSKVFVNGEFVNKWCEALNKDNESEKALNFSELVRVSRAWYKAIGGEGVGKKTPFDSAITRATALIQDDLNAIEPFSISSAKSKTLITYLVNDANKWLQAHKNNQEALKLKRSA